MVESKNPLSSITIIRKNINDFNDAVETLVTALNEHERNLEKIDREADTKSLRRETVKCCNTIKRLDTLLKDLQNFKDSVSLGSSPEANHHREQILSLELRIVSSRDSFAHLVDRKVLLNSSPSQGTGNTSDRPVDEGGNFSSLQMQHQLTEDIKTKKHICESYLHLQRNIQDLNETIQTFADLVANQGETIDSIESNVENAIVQVNQGVKELSKAARLKRVMLPATGFVLGGCVGGPVGVLLGVKVGIVTAIGSALVGYSGAKIIQKKALKDDEPSSEITQTDDLNSSATKKDN